MYWLAQILGVLPLVFSVLSYQLKHKWQMLISSALSNFFLAASFLFLGGAMSAMAVCALAVAQTLINAHHAYHGKAAGKVEKGIFFVLYLACGIWQFQSVVDIFPMGGSLFFMIATFQKKAQQIRYFQFGSTIFWIAYDCFLGSSAIVTHLFTLASILIGIFRFRKKTNTAEEQTA